MTAPMEFLTPRYNLGLVALRKNDPQKAIATFDQLLKATPDHPSGYLTRGQAHLVAQHADEAMADLEEATRRQPRSADAWLWLGKARQAAHQGPAAQSAFCKAKELGSAEAVKLCDGG